MRVIERNYDLESRPGLQNNTSVQNNKKDKSGDLEDPWITKGEIEIKFSEEEDSEELKESTPNNFNFRRISSSNYPYNMRV